MFEKILKQDIVRLCKAVLAIFLIFSSGFHARGQFYDIGQAPASTRWNTIETPDFQFIFPVYLDSFAIETARSFQHNAGAVKSGLRTQPLKTPVLLHPQSAISNAYAIWAPRRIEALTTPPQKNYAQPWMHQLGLHEYRHVVQLSKLNQGFGKGLGYLFGQQAAAILTGLFIPPWFLEGDAVLTETLLSKSGRGRVPSFSADLKAQMHEKGAYSFAKATLGSYRNYVPDIYTTGYYIVAHGRKKYGIELWNSALNHVARSPLTFTPFNRGLKKISGLDKESLYDEAVEEFITENKAEFTEAVFWPIPAVRKDFVEYHHPFKLNDSTVVALKTSFAFNPEIVKLDQSGNETTLLQTGYVMDQLVSMNNGIMAWSEYRPHIRWQTVSYTDVVMFDPVTGISDRMSFKRRLFAPVAGKKTGSFAAVGYKKDATAYIFIYNNGSQSEFSVPDGLHPLAPAWTDDGSALIFITVSTEGKSFMKLDTLNRTFSSLTVPLFAEISDPFVSGNQVYFTGTNGETSQICMIDLTSGETVVITNSQFGATNPAIKNDTLIYNEYTSDGNRIAILNTDNISTKAYNPLTPDEWPGIAEMFSQEEFPDRVKTGNSSFTINSYKKAANLFKVHSWAPVFVDIGGETARPGFSVMSQNLLSTLVLTGGYDFSMVERTGKFRADATWKGWYPELRAGFSNGKRSAITSESNTRYTWNETSIDLSASQSLNLSKGKHSRGLFGEATYTLYKTSPDAGSPDNFNAGQLSVLTYRAFAYTYERQAYRDLAPAMGINADLRFRHAAGGTLDAGNIFAVRSNIFLPGIYRNHSIGLYAGYQYSSPQEYRFQNMISTSRGYFDLEAGNVLVSLKANYRMPIVYPDFNFLYSFYIKRLRSNIFYDYTNISGGIPVTTYNSSGVDLMADMHAFGLSTPISIGFRTLYQFQTEAIGIELLFSINFYEY
ncbi:MAG: hypothetical protein FD170_2256 [Bacteroidetes bacterium]|nr:MAG: hypothetical protein FD170_2256 [Bacteroidota bacterium]